MPDDSTARPFRDGACRSRGAESGHEVHLRMGDENLATKPSAAALRKYDQQKTALAIASSGIAVTLLNGGQMHINHSSCH
ncbi:hypothetical protein TNCV_2650541 [Trichonephila clavipes]|nr:hypothetical protein TNCV_2650541 [Trichonephila clavipes]